MSGFSPTEEQERVIHAPRTAKLLVLAGAGTGKTETLIHRIERLLEEEEIQYGNILVLTFSRAAVRELRTRLRGREGESRFVRARTFDSFATLLLTNCPKAGDLTGKDYDARISMAADSILNDDDAKRLLKDVKHLVVDEMQDLVGVRQQMVRNLIEVMRASIGFTLFSDPAQSIYDYQIKDSNPPMGAQQMLEWLRREFKSELVEEKFTRDFRFETEESRTAIWARDQLLGSKPAFREIRERLRSDLRKLNTFTLDQRAVGLRRSDSSVAILCRSNAHTLLLSRELFRLKLPHSIQREQTDRCIPPWVAIVFRGLQEPEISKTDFQERYSCVTGVLAGGDAENNWSLLKRIDRSGGRSLNVVRLNESIRSGTFPDELLQPSTSRIVLSTIHRSKGLEYPHVMVADPSDGKEAPPEEDVAEEARILYVAMTRARRSLERLDAPTGCRVGKDRYDRCRLYTYRNGLALVSALELRGNDIHAVDPAGAFGFEGDVPGIQRYIEESVRIGDEVELHCTDITTQDEMRQKHFIVYHSGRCVGITSGEAFQALRIALTPPKVWGKFEIRWPARISGLHVEVIDTVAGSPATSRKYGLGISGLWLRVRVAGLGNLHFKDGRSASDGNTK